MIRFFSHISIKTATAALSVLLTVSSCEFRPLYIEDTLQDVLVLMDWTQLGENPDGASIYFFSENDDKSYVFPTNNVTRRLVSVPAGEYSVMVFNRTVDEFGSLNFKGMDKLSTSECILNSRYFGWVGRSDSVGRTVYEPEEIVSNHTDHFVVHPIKGNVVKKYKGQDSLIVAPTYADSVLVIPQLMLYEGKVNILVNGIQNLKSVRAYLTGMAGQEYMSSRTSGNELATHVLESWSVQYEATDYTKGSLHASFRCFGLPTQQISYPEKEINKLVMQFLLVDEETLKEEIRYVGYDIVQDEKERTVTVTVGPVDLPDVKPKGGKESGFDVNFSEWDAPVEIPVSI